MDVTFKELHPWCHCECSPNAHSGKTDILPLLDQNHLLDVFIKAFFVVGLVEEFSKYVVVRYIAQRNKEFDEPFDGIVYAVMVSMGFATLENILYVYSYGYETGVLRAFTAVPAHATFAVLMGYFMGKAKFSNRTYVFNLTGLLAATLFHGAYDFFLFIAVRSRSDKNKGS